MSDDTRTRDTAALIAGLRTLSSLEEKMPDGSWRQYGIHPTLSAAADALEASEAARANLEAVIAEARAARANHPVCDRYPDDGPVTCGWKSAVLDVDAAFSRVGDPVVLREHDAKVWDEGLNAAVVTADRAAREVGVFWPPANPYRGEGS